MLVGTQDCSLYVLQTAPTPYLDEVFEAVVCC